MAAILQTMRSGGTDHPEEIVNFLTSRMVETGGVFDKGSDHLKCEEQAVPDMTVLVNQGYAFIPKSDGSMAYPVRLYNDDDSATITSNASGNPRIDAVVLYIDLAESANAAVTNVAKIEVVAGTPAASPSKPDSFAIQSAIGASNPYIVLAYVTVASGASEIENADIEDARQQIRASQKLDFSKCGDVKMSIRATADEGWLIMNDETIGDVGSGADHEGAHLEELFGLLESDYNQTPTAAWGSGGTIIIPKMDGKKPVGYDSTDSDYNALGKTSGAKTATLAIANMPAHDHGGGIHSHGVTDPGHYHGVAASGSGAGHPAVQDGTDTTFNTNSATTGVSINNSASIINSQGSGDAFSIKDPGRVFNFMIKW